MPQRPQSCRLAVETLLLSIYDPPRHEWCMFMSWLSHSALFPDDGAHEFDGVDSVPLDLSVRLRPISLYVLMRESYHPSDAFAASARR